MCCNVSKNGVSKKVSPKSKHTGLQGPNGAFMFPQLHAPFLGYFTLTSNACKVG